MTKVKQSKKEKMAAALSAGLTELPKRSNGVKISEVAAKAFERREVSGAPASEADSKTPKRPRSRRSRRSIPVDQTERWNVFVPLDLAAKAGAKLARLRLSMSQAVCDALELWVAEDAPAAAAQPTAEDNQVSK